MSASADQGINLNDLMGSHQDRNSLIAIHAGFVFPEQQQQQQQQQQQPNGPYVGCIENSTWSKFVLKREVRLEDDQLIAPDFAFALNANKSPSLKKMLATVFANKRAVLSCEGSHIKPIYVFYNRSDSDVQDQNVFDPECFKLCTGNGGQTQDCKYACTQTDRSPSVDHAVDQAVCEIRNTVAQYRDQLYTCTLIAE